MKFNEIIRAAMKESGITQKHLGELLGIHQSAVSNMLNRPEPSLATFREVLDIMGYEVIVQKKGSTPMALTKE